MKMRATINGDPAKQRRAKKFLKPIDAGDDPASAVDEMIGSATLREPPPGADPLYDALKAKYVH